ncbi:MAG: DUF2764 domain-containing protein [Methylomonas sp.]|nr:DUF2764 domain-containing protein [Methylomonas sp.]PPD26746.1 MAG: hypothetical protein CTY22_04090 [Methylomonas sp.]PPD38582.1 MAG: hypothetical protein CTY21_04090 [Methylomonas sp.]PPD42799.1 MAG: hypothetical protein CTY17_00430 [Methylomonas sp.]PPD55975.1 MAG: hypothetical protein CTY11_00120 [Methylomonas sp.]
MISHASCRYAMLVCYLPPLPPHPFAGKSTPLSRLQLDRRLALLEPEDARDLATLEEIVHWEHIPLASTDENLALRARDALTRLRTPALREMLIWRLELRTLVGALRRRRLGLSAPTVKETWGWGGCLDSVRRHWERSDFNLGHRYPWLAVAERHLMQGEHTALENLLFTTVWEHYVRLAWKHHFDFEAVVLYVLRWHLLDRLTRYAPAAASQRFGELLAQGLGGQDRLFTAPSP